jgi:hypothetical protein
MNFNLFSSKGAAVSFNRRDIRRTMDVYTCDNIYLGTVLAVTAGAPVHPGQNVAPPPAQPSEVNGELLGPMPTMPVGNLGPLNQGAGRAYATVIDPLDGLGTGSLAVGKWWGLRGRYVIPLDAVQTVSLERVILRVSKDDLRRA